MRWRCSVNNDSDVSLRKNANYICDICMCEWPNILHWRALIQTSFYSTNQHVWWCEVWRSYWSACELYHCLRWYDAVRFGNDLPAFWNILLFFFSSGHAETFDFFGKLENFVGDSRRHIPKGIITVEECYELDGLAIESQWGWDFLRPSKPALGHHQPLIQWVSAIIPRGKAAGAWR